MAGTETSVEGEAEFESGAHAHRLPVLDRGMKANFSSRLDGGLGQSVRLPAHRADVVNAPVSAEDDCQHNRALDFVQTGLFGVFGFFTIENRGSQFLCHGGCVVAGTIDWAASNLETPTAGVSAIALVKPRPFSRS